MPQPEHPTQQLSVLTKKRQALESLIKITISIQSQQQSLQELSAIARPSQEFPAKLLTHIKLLSKKIGDLPVPELIQRLEVVERVMAKGLDKLLLLAKIAPNKLRYGQLSNLSVDDFVEAIDNFKRRTQTAMALRFLLKDRGVAIAPFSLAVPQESIFEHIEALKIKEQRCVKQVRKEIVSIIKDSDVMMKSESFTEEMKKEILKVRQAMQVNLDHLDSGGSIVDIPNVFETVVLESCILEPINDGKPNTEKSDTASNKKMKASEEKDSGERSSQTNKDQVQEKNTAKTQKKSESFWGLVKIWLASPWNVSWRSIKKDSKK